MALVQLVYTSRAAQPFTPAQLHELTQHCIQNNAQHDITGLLMYSRGWFIQMLEGEREAVDATFSKIAADDRHVDVSPLLLRTAPYRMFTDWAMGLLNLEEHGELDASKMHDVLLRGKSPSYNAALDALALLKEFRSQLPAVSRRL
jgi:hypothetical protein